VSTGCPAPTPSNGCSARDGNGPSVIDNLTERGTTIMAATKTPPTTLSARDAAEYIGISVWQFYKDVQQGLHKNVEDGGTIIRRGTRFRVSARRLAEWVDGGAR